MTDLLRPTMNAFYANLNVPAVKALAPVFTNVPPKTEPPFIEIGAIDAEIIGTEGGLERHSVEIEFQHRGASRLPLFAMMAAARAALDHQPLTATGALLEPPRWLASATDREEDGVTYHGIHRFELLVQPNT